MKCKLRKDYDPARCAATVGRDFFIGQCTRAVAVQHEGVGYCRQHDPEARRQKQEAQAAKWRAKWDRDAAVRRARELRLALATAAIAYVESHYAPERRAEMTELAGKVREAEAAIALHEATR